MKLTIESAAPSKLKVDAVVLGVFEDFESFRHEAPRDIRSQASLSKFKGKLGEAFFSFDTAFEPKKHLLLVGLGRKKDYGPPEARTAAACATRKLRERFARSAAFSLCPAESGGSLADAVASVAEGVILSNSRFDRYLTDRDKLFEGLSGACIVVEKGGKGAAEGLALGKALSEAVLFARDLITLPSNEVTPAYLAEEALSLAKAYGFSAKVMEARECEKLGMNAFLAVAAGSANAPRFIHLSYRAKGAKKTVGIIGKGLTFDSGGISLKPGEGMGAMKSDMSGAAAVLGAMKAVGELRPKVNVEMVVAACENMPSGTAYRPGDVIRSMSGKTIEVQNTDAEGRLTLADALTYTQKLKVDEIIDLATLTGACVVALGTDIAGIMGNDQKLMDRLIGTSKLAGDALWQLPLDPNYMRFIKSPIADVCNISRVRWGGAITAGLFLKVFVDDGTPWTHIDIAGPAYRDDDLNENHKAEGAGFGVRLLVRHLLGG